MQTSIKDRRNLRQPDRQSNCSGGPGCRSIFTPAVFKSMFCKSKLQVPELHTRLSSCGASSEAVCQRMIVSLASAGQNAAFCSKELLSRICANRAKMLEEYFGMFLK
jgi:hypothetical protein